VGRLRKKGLKNVRSRNQMERSCRGQGQMARFVISFMVLKAEAKKKKKRRRRIINT